MCSLIKKMFFVVLVIALSSTTCLSVDFDIGQVIELSEDNNYIQVKDTVYKIDTVVLLYQEGSPLPGSPKDLSEGSIVKVIRGTKEDDYWNSTLVTVYLGEMEKQIREELELPINESKESTNKVNKPALNRSIELKDGVWVN